MLPPLLLPTAAEAHTVRTPGGGRSSASTHGDGVSHGEELSAAVPERMATPVRGSPPLAADDGDGSGGGGALHLHASSYVQSQVCRFKVGAPQSPCRLQPCPCHVP